MTAALSPSSPLGLYRGWWITGVCFIMAFFAWGTVFYGHGFYIQHLTESKGWPTATLSLGVGLGYLAGIPATIVIGRLIDRFGSRWIAVAGAVGIAAGITAIGQVREIWQLIPVYLLLGAAYPAMATATISGSLLPWFNRRLGLALSLALTGASIGGASLVPALVFASQSIGFAAAMAATGGLIALIVIPLVLIFFRPRTVSAATVAPAPDRPSAMGTRAYLLSPQFWRITLAASLGLGAQVGFLTHQIPALESSLGVAGAAFAVSVTALAAIAGRFLLGALSARYPLNWLAAGCYLLQAVGLVLIAVTDVPWLLYLASGLAGLVVGAIVMLPPLLLSAAFGKATYGTAYGLTNMGLFGAAGLTVALAGWLRDLSGDYVLVFVLLSGLQALAALGMLAKFRAKTSPES